MGALLSLPITVLDFLLPFTKAGTPLTQDILHTVILCGTLYFGPQIAEWYNVQQSRHRKPGDPVEGSEQVGQANVDTEELPLDERLILRDDGDGDAGPPPLAPTPPPDHHQNLHHQPHIEDDDDEDPQRHLPEPLLPQPNIDNDAGPANPPPNAPRATHANRTIGAKKAKSLARKDQRRAYHEFHRQEAELRRLQDAEGAEQREAVLAAERERRARIEDEIREKEREERERIKKEREHEAQEEIERRERVVREVSQNIRAKGAVDLVDVAWTEGKDRVWVEKLVRASGLMGALQREGGYIRGTGAGWLVRVDAELMERIYRDATLLGSEQGGRVSYKDFGGMLEKAVLARIRA